MEKVSVLTVPNLETKNKQLFNVEKIDLLSEIIKKEPFLSGEKVVSVVDLDGVLCEYGRKNNADDNLSRLLGLRRIIEGSDEFVFYSSRIKLDEDSRIWKVLKPVFGETSVVKCPFMIDSSMERLQNFANKANENCKFEFKVGFKKMRSCFGDDDNFSDLVEKTLRQDKKLVMVGSSIFDRQIISKTAKEMDSKGLDSQKMYFFDTGHWIV